MGEVYRARDTILKRDVALKVLPAALAHDPERMARFQREAELLASLNHSNIAILHGLVESDGQRALVMELVPGETLGARIKRGAMPPEEALRVARQIAEALEAAHERGVVHRDLKPGNVMITPDGLVKALDFGLAAIVQGASATPADPFDSPTLTMNMTQAGVILGTAAYMSPEQAAGTPVDRRADIWSYGVVLWEMLRGRRLFGGDTIAHTLADVLRGPIDFEKVTAPAPIQNLLRRCLDRDVKTRLRDIGEARVTIGKYLSDPMSGTEVARQPKGRPAWIALQAAWQRFSHRSARSPRSSRMAAGRGRRQRARRRRDLAFTIAPAAADLASVGDLAATPDISPDGSAVVFYANDGKAHLRQLNRLAARTRAHGDHPKLGLLVSGLPVVRVFRQEKPEEDARPRRRAGKCRQRCRRSGGRKLERQRQPYFCRCREGFRPLYAVPGGRAERAKRISKSVAFQRATFFPRVLARQRGFLCSSYVCRREGSTSAKSTSATLRRRTRSRCRSIFS